MDYFIIICLVNPERIHLISTKMNIYFLGCFHNKSAFHILKVILLICKNIFNIRLELK